jgi:hypothetical protein
VKLVKILALALIVTSLVLSSVAFATTKSTVKRFSLTGSVVAIGPGDTFKVKVKTYSVSLKGYIGKDREFTVQIDKNTKLFLATLVKSKTRTILRKDKSIEFSTLKEKDQVIVKGTIIKGTPNTFLATEIDIITPKAPKK